MTRTKPPKTARIKKYGHKYVQAHPDSTPVKWDERFIDIIEKAIAKGLTQRDVAEMLNVHIATLEYWIRTKPEVKEAQKRGDQQAIENVKKSYYQLAMGYSHPDTVVLANRVKEYDAEGKVIREYNQPLLVPIIKHYPPNAFACHKILTIKDRENWMDIQKIENTVNFNLTQNVNLSEYSDTELVALEKMGLNALVNGTRSN